MAPRGKELSTDLRECIIKLYLEDKTQRQIAEIVGKSRATVQKTIERYNQEGNNKTKRRSGRPSTFTPSEKRIIVRKVQKDPKISAPKIQMEIENEVGKVCSTETIRKVLHTAGYHGRQIRKKPFVSPINRKKRLSFAKEYETKDQSFWNTVIFSDESKFNIHGSDGRAKVWRKPNSELEPQNMMGTVKHGGGSVLVWGCMAASGVGKLVFIDGIMDRFVYLDILKNNLHESAENLGIGESFVFQQDNDPKHTALIVKEWLIYKVKNQLKTPPQSPDINPIEHLWDHLDRQIRKHQIRNREDLKNALLEEWEKIPPSVTTNLVSSMQNRLKAVIKHKGFPTKY